MHRLLLLAVLLLASCEEIPVFPEAEEACSVQLRVQGLRALDGDTIEFEWLEGDRVGYVENVRLVGIDTPEISEGDCHAEEAAARLAELVEGQELWFAFDQECTDNNGRVLAYVYRASDELFVNRNLVETGHASACPFGENLLHADEFAEAEAQAWQQQLGQWGEPCFRELGQCFPDGIAN